MHYAEKKDLDLGGGGGGGVKWGKDQYIGQWYMTEEDTQSDRLDIFIWEGS